jgi:hypothetical protein
MCRPVFRLGAEKLAPVRAQNVSNFCCLNIKTKGDTMKLNMRVFAISSILAIASVVGLSHNPSQTYASAPKVISGAGDKVPEVVEDYRSALGGENNGGKPGSQSSGRREINWDAVPDQFSAPEYMPLDFFNAPTEPRARGAMFGTPGSGVQVSADSDNPTDTAVRFSHILPSYRRIFHAFSEQKLFSPIGSNIVDLTFYVPGTDTPAVVKGFGAVYLDVDTAHTAFEYFDVNGQSLGTYEAPMQDNGQSFLGVVFPTAIVHRVRIHYGTTTLGAEDSRLSDVAVMDDFIYGEPQPLR